MININNKRTHTGAVICAAFFAVILEGCGAERTTPLNVTTTCTSSSSSSSVTSVTMTKIGQVTALAREANIDYKGRTLQVALNEADFNIYADTYLGQNIKYADYASGRVVLVDMGQVDNCSRHFTLNSISAQKDGSNRTKVIVKYNDVSATTSGCTTAFTRPVYVYFVDSADPVIFEEDL